MTADEAAKLSREYVVKPTIKEGYTLIKSFPPGEAIVGIIKHNDDVIVATSQRVFTLIDGRFHPMEFVMLPDAAKEP